MTTPILGITELALGQIDQFLTANTAFRALEAAGNDFLSVNLASGNVTLSATQFASALLFRSSGNAVARNLTVPAAKRFFAVHNNGSFPLNVVRGSTTITVPVAQAYLLYADGTTNGLMALAGGGGGGSLTVVDESTTARTLALADAGAWIRCTNGGVVEVTVPPASSVPWSVGATMYIRQVGAGSVTIVPGSGVTVTPPAGGTLVLTGPGAAVGLICVGTDAWELTGQVEVAP